MMRALKRVIVGLAAAGALVSGISYAQAPQREWTGGRMDTGLYLGAAVGHAKADIGVGLPSGVWFDSSNTDDTSFGWKLFAGFPFYPGLAIELGYIRLGRFSFNGTTMPTGTLTSNWRVLGYNADLVATLPVAYKFSILARIGGYYNETSPRVSSSGAINALAPGGSDREWNLKTGLGIHYDVSRAMALRAEWEHFRELGPTKLNLDLYTFGLLYRVE